LHSFFTTCGLQDLMESSMTIARLNAIRRLRRRSRANE
jgi:hypothetical protein